MSYKNLTIERGQRHCKIVDEEDNVVFRTTNVRDAQDYLALIEEIDRLQRLLDARGMAPHRIYLLASDEDKRGRVNFENVPAKEVVIVAKAENDSVVVRYLDDGKEEIVDLEEIEPIEGGSYLQGSDVQDEAVHVVMRFDRDNESATLAVFRSVENADELASEWQHGEEAPGTEYGLTLVHSEGDILLYRSDSSIED
ncbi:MAG: hypothetical protein H0U74_08970 [Bradymonadaceae bacterium]|nr:hypothetical protein [Lujinxingiaceae bacterium]